MAQKPMVGARIPVEWRDEIEKLAQRTGRPVSQVVYEAIAAYLNKDTAGTMLSRVDQLSGKVETLERQVNALRALVA